MADVDSSMLLFCREIKKDVKVVLSGECSDEIFAGYPWFFREDALKSNTFPWSIAIDERQNLLNENLSSKINLKEYIDIRYKQSLSKIEFLDTDSDQTKEKRKISYLTIKWFMQTLLDRADRTSMYNGLELRVPFCDYRLVEYLWNIPWELKALNGREKGLLRYVVKNKLPYVEFDKTNNYKVGDIVIVAGNPYNLGVSVSTGIISALNRNLKMTSFDNFIQTDASINKGNSGGPMFNLRGKVIGLTSAIYSPDGSNVGIGFAMPTTDLLPLIEELKRYGYVKRGTIGITVENVQKEIFEVLDINNRRYGVIIVNVKTDSSAEKAGLLVSDIILKYNGKRVRNARELSLLIASTEIDSKVNLEVLRNNKIINISVKIEENKENYKYDPEYEALLSKAVEIFDAVLIPINKTAKKRFDIQENKGMYVLKTKKGGLADKKGIRTGDIILSINQDQAIDGDIILQNIHNAELNRSKYVFVIVKSMNKNNLIFMPISNNTSSKIAID